MGGSSLQYMNYSICTYNITFEVGDSASIVQVIFFRSFQFGIEIDQ
jgi:hypothetical protein